MGAGLRVKSSGRVQVSTCIAHVSIKDNDRQCLVSDRRSNITGSQRND